MQKTPLIEPKKLDISSAILSEIKSVYGADTAKNVKPIIEKISAQREIIRNIKGYTTTDDINQYNIYFDYLCQLNSFIPLVDKRAPKFEWKSVYGKIMKCMDIRFEICCVLLNLGILYSQEGFNNFLVENDEPRLRKVIESFKMAAGVFEKIKNEYQEDIQTLNVGEDLHPTVIQIYYLMAIAQCQHMYFILGKTISPDKSPLLSALSHSCFKFYTQLADLCSSHKFFPKDLGNHFRLQSYFTKILAIHYYGESLLKRQVEENAGKAFALARQLKPLLTTTKTFMNSFYLEQADAIQGEAVFKLVANDCDQFYNLYRIFNTNVPESVDIPFGDKAIPASDLNFGSFPLGLAVPENDLVDKGIAEYKQKKNKIIEECEEKGRELYSKVENELLNRNLPDLVDGSVMQDLPANTRSRIEEIIRKGGISTLQQFLDEVKLALLNVKEECGEFIQTKSTDMEYHEQCMWMQKNIDCAEQNIKKADQKMGTVNSNSPIFSKSLAELAVSIPVCRETMNAPPTSLKNIIDKVVDQKRQYQHLLRQLQTESSGENTIRRKLQDPKNSLIMSAVLSEAFIPLERLCNEINKNISLEEQYLEAMQSEFDSWFSKQHFSPAMKARLDSIRSINHAILCYYEVEDICRSTKEVLQMVKETCN